MRKLTCFLALSLAGLSQPTEKVAALEGLDPVLLTEGQEVPGKETLSAEHGRFLYRFSSEATRDKFSKDPDRYGIQLDGACARMGAPSSGSPDSYFVHKNRIYVFGSNDCYKKFTANPSKYLESEQPKPEWSPTPQSRERGAAALKEIIAALGGETGWKSIRAYSETRKIEQSGAVMTYTVRLPDSVYNESASGANKFGAIATPDGAAGLFNGRQTPYPKSFGKAIIGDVRNQLIAILASAGGKDFEVYQASAGNLRIRNHENYVNLFADPATHRVSALTWHGRSPDGFSELRADYSDYREVNGLKLPFHIQATVKGSDFARSWNIESYQINPPNVDSVFALKAK